MNLEKMFQSLKGLIISKWYSLNACPHPAFGDADNFKTNYTRQTNQDSSSKLLLMRMPICHGV
jgi:hypothetical protein